MRGGGAVGFGRVSLWDRPGIRELVAHKQRRAEVLRVVLVGERQFRSRESSARVGDLLDGTRR